MCVCAREHVTHMFGSVCSLVLLLDALGDTKAQSPKENLHWDLGIILALFLISEKLYPQVRNVWS